MMNREVEKFNISISAIAIGDLINFFLAYIPVVMTYFCTYLIIQFWIGIGHLPLVIIFILTPLVLIFTLITIIYLIRLVIPKLKEGIYPVGFNRNYIAWILHLCLGRSVKISGLFQIIYAFNFLKVLLFKALGMKVSFNFVSSLYIQIVDFSLIEIGEGVILTDHTRVSAHTMIRNKLWIKKIIIGNNVYVGAESVIGLGSKIKDNCVIGPHNIIFNNILEEGTTLAPFEWEKGKK